MTSRKHTGSGPARPAGKKGAAKARAEAPKGPKAPGRKTTRRELGLLVALTGLLAIVLMPRLGSGSSVPVELNGRWTTDDPRYENRALVITDSTVAFYMGSDPISVHRVSKTRSEPAEFEGVQYDVEYETEGEPQTLSVIYEASPSETLRLRHRPEMAWTRTDPGAD